MTQQTKEDRPVNRLHDIVVEEVSLVDRAANEHRFLIVKRDSPMPDNAETIAHEDVDAEDVVDLSHSPEVESATTAPVDTAQLAQLMTSLKTTVEALLARPVEAHAEAGAKLTEVETKTEAEPAKNQELKESIAAVTESLRALAETVKEQHQRLSRVEKSFGMPNSAPNPERVQKAEPEEVGWPMDLNQPMDRESVDKAVSFHDM